MKNVLVLENEFIQSDDMVNRIIEKFREEGDNIVIIEQAYQQPKETLVQAILAADKLLFQTTWLRTEQLSPFGNLLAIAKPLEIYAISICSHTLEHNLEKTFEVEILAKLSKHKLFDVVDRWGEKENWVREVNLDVYQEKLDKEEEERQNLYKGLKKTGFKILIKTIQAHGKQWSNLKEGDIVEELDYSEHDPNPKRGVWVMGNGEPVKLLNSDGYDEFEFADDKCFALAHDFFARGNARDQKDLIILVAQYINGYLQRDIRTGEKTLWDFCDELCNTVGVERRGNRRYFETRLKRYIAKHTYLTEIERTDRRFLTSKLA